MAFTDKRIAKKLGRELQAMRRAVGLTQSEVAAALDYNTPQFVSNWERAVSLPPADALPIMAALYGVSKKELVELIMDARAEDLDAERKTMIKGRAS